MVNPAEQSTFPSQIDTFNSHYEILASDIPNVQRYQQLVTQVTRTPAEETELTNLKTTLIDKIFSATDLNKIQNCMVALEDYFLNTVIADIRANTDTGILRTDVGFPVNLTTTDKSSLTNAINEVKAEANTNSTNIGTLSSFNTTDKSSVVNAVNEHIGKTNNPHGTTATQVGAYSKSESDGKYALSANPYFYYKGGLWGAIASSNTLNQVAVSPSLISGCHMSGSDIIVDVAGKYVLEFSALISGLSLNATFDILIRVVRSGTNTDDVSSVMGAGQGSTNPNPQGVLNYDSIMYDLQVGDIIRFFVRASEAPHNINNVWIKGFKISN